MIKHTILFAALSLSVMTAPGLAHYEDGKHTVHKSSTTTVDPWKWLELLTSPATAATPNVSVTTDTMYRYVRSEGIPDHTTGMFPSRGCPNTIMEQHYTFRMPLSPQFGTQITPIGHYPFGVAVNGIPFDPGAREFWNNDPYSGWQYEAMALGPRLGLDQNNAHVQPNGAYHYHGPPTALLAKLREFNRQVLLGYAADGFPIYGPYAQREKSTSLSPLRSSYRIKPGTRPNGPTGSYDGLFVQDYEYVAGSGDLDECNGRFGKTPEYPSGTYYYVISESYPYIPRNFKGIPDSTFMAHGHPGHRPPPPWQRPPF